MKKSKVKKYPWLKYIYTKINTVLTLLPIECYINNNNADVEWQYVLVVV